MTPAQSLANIELIDNQRIMAPEIQTVRAALAAGRKDLRNVTKARGILEACLMDIHASDPSHKSAIECAWMALRRLDAE